MKFFTITKVVSFLHTSRIAGFHADMFHGLAKRDGKEYPKFDGVWAYSENPSNLTISRTARSVPEISAPAGDLVLSQKVADRIRHIPNIRLWPVIFDRLVDVPYAKGDMSYVEKWGREVKMEPRLLLRTLPDVPEFHKAIGTFYEVQTWRLQDVIDRYSDATVVTIQRDMPGSEESEAIRISPQMLRDYPIIWSGDILVNSEAYELLREGLDTDFFLVREYELSFPSPTVERVSL